MTASAPTSPSASSRSRLSAHRAEADKAAALRPGSGPSRATSRGGEVSPKRRTLAERREGGSAVDRSRNLIHELRPGSSRAAASIRTAPRHRSHQHDGRSAARRRFARRRRTFRTEGGVRGLWLTLCEKFHIIQIQAAPAAEALSRGSAARIAMPHAEIGRRRPRVRFCNGASSSRLGDRRG